MIDGHGDPDCSPFVLIVYGRDGTTVIDVEIRTLLSGSSDVGCWMIGSKVFSHHVCQ